MVIRRVLFIILFEVCPGLICGPIEYATLSNVPFCFTHPPCPDFGADQAAGFMNRLAKFAARYLGNRGFSIGIDDVTPSDT